jgi:predicted SAM-dependent methyltransferase
MINDKVNELINRGEAVRLHLGCGPFLFDGYLNIDGDYIQNPAVINYDISLTPYPLPDNSVDEILSVHVIEHIERWLIEDMLKEWLRILKPGGIVAVEWPDLLKACKMIVNEPDGLRGENKKLAKHTLHAIYGNPRFSHRAMMHAYGYSVDSLSDILLKVGFSKTTSEENLYRKTAVDSRVIGTK